MSQLATTLITNLVAISGAMVLLWLVSLPIRNVSIADVFWGLGFIGVAGLSSAINSPVTSRMALATCLVATWGARLACYIGWRNAGHGEDRRYAAMREGHGATFWWVSLFTVFLLQAVILWFVSLPLQALAVTSHQDRLWTVLDGIGLALWILGFAFEAVGDWQLASFKANDSNGGKVMDRGLWRYTRHPNYFGDFCIWWGLYLVAASDGTWWTILSPAVMSILLVKVSGVGLLEKTIEDRRPPYIEYKRRTSAFIPLPPRAKIE